MVRWRITQRHFFMQSNAKAKCATYHAASNLFVVGFSNGLFGLYELPAFNMIHTLRWIICDWEWIRKWLKPEQYISNWHRFCERKQIGGVAGFWSLQAGTATSLGVAVRVLHPQAAGPFWCHERIGILSRWSTHHHSRRWRKNQSLGHSIGFLHCHLHGAFKRRHCMRVCQTRKSTLQCQPRRFGKSVGFDQVSKL